MGRDLLSSKKKRANGQQTGTVSGVEARLKQYQGMDASTLEQQLFTAVAQQKATGEFDAVGLDRMFQKLSPMLSDEQKQRMRQLIQKVKD